VGAETLLWPWVDRVVESWAVPGVAVGLVEGDRLMVRGFGTRDRATGAPVTADTLFHLASISKTFVATAVLQLVESERLSLDGPVTAYLPDLPWADARAGDITLRHLLSHRSGLGDVADYGWHRPELDDGALARFAADVAGWSLEREPGSGFAYSNTAYEVLGHLVATIVGTTFEAALAERVLAPAGMTTSTFLRAEVPAGLGARPHLGLPPQVVDGAYPYSRRHAPSSTLHSSATELGRWMAAHLDGGAGLMAAATHEAMWEPQAVTGWSERHGQIALGWFRGRYRNHTVMSHAGNDPGFATNLVLVPELGLGVVVLADSNTAPVLDLTLAALDALLGRQQAEPPLPPVTVPLAAELSGAGVAAAADRYATLAAADPPAVDLDPDRFEDAVWGAVEMHRTGLVRPLLELWRAVQPESARAWFMAGWADAVDGRRDDAIEHLRRAAALDPDDDDVAALTGRLAAGP
jgi:CubicO group peptidase (beta-lactamase class C family)